MTSVVGTILLVHLSHFILEGLVGTLSVTYVPIALNRDKCHIDTNESSGIPSLQAIR